MTEKDLEQSVPSTEADLKGQQRLSQQQYRPQGQKGDQAGTSGYASTNTSTFKGIFGANDPVVPAELQANPVKPATVADGRGSTPAVSDQNVGTQPAVRHPVSDQGTTGTTTDGSSSRTTPITKSPTSDGVAPSRVIPGGADQQSPIDRVLTSPAPVANEMKPYEAPVNRSGESVANAERNPLVKISDSGNVRPPVDSQASVASTRSNGVFTYITTEDNKVRVARQPQEAQETAPGVPKGALERLAQSANLATDGGQQKPFVAADSQPRTNLSSENPGGQNQTRSVTPERVDVSAIVPKGNTASIESANVARPNATSLESQNQYKPTSLNTDAQTRTAPGPSPDAGSRDLPSRDGLTRTTAGVSALDSQGRPLPAAVEKLPLGSDNRQANMDAAGVRATGSQTSLDGSAKPIGSNAANEFGTRREAGVQLPDTKQASGRTDSGVQLPDTKQSSGRTDTGGIKMPDSRNDTGRNDANTGKLPDAKTLANLDQKFGDKVNPPGKGAGMPIPMPGIPDILGGLRGDKDGKPVKDAKPDLQGTKEGAVRSEAPGGRDAKDGKGELQGTKDPKVPDGRGDTKSGVDDKGAIGQKGIRQESDGTTKSGDGKTVHDVRTTTPDGRVAADGKPLDGRSQGGSNLVHDGGSKSEVGAKSEGVRAGRLDGADRSPDKGSSDRGFGDKGLGDKGSGDKGAASEKGLGDGKTRVDQPGSRTADADGKLIGGRSETGSTIKVDLGDKGHTDVAAGGKGIGSRGEAPLVLPPGSLPVPDLVGGIKNMGQQIDGRTGKPIPTDDKGLRQPDKGSDAGKLDPGKGIGGKAEIGKGDPIKGDGIRADSKGNIGDGVKTIVTGGVAGDGVKTIVTGGVAGEGVKTAVTGGAKVGEGVKSVGTSDSAVDGKQLSGKNPTGTKADGAIIVPPSAVPLTEMIGNLKGIAARIFPPESRAGRPDAFDNSLPGRKTERLEDRVQSTLGSGVRAESTIPIVRVIGERIGKADEQFVIKLTQAATDANKAPQSRSGTPSPPPWIAPEHAVSDKSVPGLKAVDVSAAKSAEAKTIKTEVQQTAPKVGDHQVPHVEKPDQIAHDEAAERLLVNLELVGSVESAPASESDEEEVFPLAAIEYFGGEFEKAISDEEDVMFDGDGVVADNDEQSTRYQYIVEAGDTVELIAIKVFKNVTLAPLIYEINKDAIPIGMQDGRMVFTLKVGTVIWLPFPKEIKAYMQT